MEQVTISDSRRELLAAIQRIQQVADTARELGVMFEDLDDLEMEAGVSYRRHFGSGRVSVILELTYNPEDYGLAPFPNPETVDIIRDMALADILDLKLSDISPALEIVGSSK